MNKKELMQRVVDLEHENLKLKNMNDIYKRQIKVIGFQFSSLNVECNELKKELTTQKIYNNALKKEIGDYRVEMTRNDLLNFIDYLQDKIDILKSEKLEKLKQNEKMINEARTSHFNTFKTFFNFFIRR